MANRTRTRVRTRPAGRRGQPAARPSRRPLLLAVAAAAVAVVVVVVWAVSATRDTPAAGAPVEQFTHVHGLAVPAWAPEEVFLSTHHGLILVSDWSHASEHAHDFMGFAAHPTLPDVLYSSGHPAPGSGIPNPVGFMVSTDRGVTWQVRSLEGQADFHAMTVGAGGAVVYGWNVAGDVGLHRSTDDGHTWTVTAAAPLHAAGGALTLASHPADPDLLWAGTGAGLLSSQDAGATWDAVLAEVAVTALAYDPADPDRLLAYAPQPGEGLIESLDGGQTWAPVGWTLPPDDAIGHLAVHPADPRRLIAGTYQDALLRSDDGGRTWHPLARAGRPIA